MDLSKVDLRTKAGCLLAVRQIAKREGVDVSDALENLIRSAIRLYFLKNGLGCGFSGCTRLGCCDGRRRPRPLLKILKGGDCKAEH
jgi:hypothetical protein